MSANNIKIIPLEKIYIESIARLQSIGFSTKYDASQMFSIKQLYLNNPLTKENSTSLVALKNERRNL